MPKEIGLIYPELSYKVTGLLFKVHNEIGQFGREKQYGDLFEKLLKEAKLDFQREKPLPLPNLDNKFTNIVDFAINNQLLVDLKAKPLVTKDDFSQMKRYLDVSGYRLGFIVNFHQKYLKPIRIVKVDKR
jgi:GxxExxY protein